MPDPGPDAFRYIICTSKQPFKVLLSFADEKTKTLKGQMTYQRPQLVNILASWDPNSDLLSSEVCTLPITVHATGLVQGQWLSKCHSSSNQEHKPVLGQPAEGKPQQPNVILGHTHEWEPPVFVCRAKSHLTDKPAGQLSLRMVGDKGAASL